MQPLKRLQFAHTCMFLYIYMYILLSVVHAEACTYNGCIHFPSASLVQLRKEPKTWNPLPLLCLSPKQPPLLPAEHTYQGS